MCSHFSKIGSRQFGYKIPKVILYSVKKDNAHEMPHNHDYLCTLILLNLQHYYTIILLSFVNNNNNNKGHKKEFFFFFLETDVSANKFFMYLKKKNLRS